ncbi:hypothetical protein D1007_28540 [Hordeum vulgare]|nr:hypothetical protein D1007_28540 [Hordeum vulgare]
MDMPETSIAPTISPKSPPCRIVFLSPLASSRSPPLPPPHRLAVPHFILFLTFIASICKMAEAHGDAGAAAGDVVELQGAVTADEVKDVGGIHGGAGKLATVADVEKEVAVSALVLPKQKEDDGWGKKRNLAFTGFDLYDPEYSDDEEYEGNFASFTAKEVEKIKAKGVASFHSRKIKKW